MNKKIINITTICLASALLIINYIPTNAAKSQQATGNAGISAAFADSYYIDNNKKNIITGYTNLGIAKVKEHLNIRTKPDENSKLAGQLFKNGACEILSAEGSWSHILSGDVEGYVKSKYLITGEKAQEYAESVATKIAVVNTQTLKLRQKSNKESTVITLIPEGERLEVIKEKGKWFKISFDGQEGYVAEKYVDISYELEKASTLDELEYRDGVSDVRSELVNYAMQFIGNPYVWGGVSLTDGADCSGFVLSVYADFGIGLPHYSVAQANCGTQIDPQDAQPGDLFFYSDGTTINHVAIYIGDGAVVQAHSEEIGITVTSAYYRTPVCVVSLL